MRLMPRVAAYARATRANERARETLGWTPRYGFRRSLDPRGRSRFMKRAPDSARRKGLPRRGEGALHDAGTFASGRCAPSDAWEQYNGREGEPVGYRNSIGHGVRR